MKKMARTLLVVAIIFNLVLSTLTLNAFAYSDIDETGWWLKDGALSLTENTDTSFIAEGTTSMQLFYELGQNGKPDYATIERNISNTQYKSLHFKVYNRNGAGVGIFKVKAIAYDESGVAHDLGLYPDDGNLGWSWPTNWFTYEKPLPTGVVINKIQIQLINNNTAQTPAFGPSGPGENWIFIDELKFIEPVDTTGLGESNWSISDGAISLVPNTDTQFVAEGATSMQLFYEMGQNGKPDYATIEKVITNSQNKSLHFKVYNRNGAGVGIFKVKAIAYDDSGVAHDLGSYPDDGNLGWSWPTNWFTYEKPLPTGVVINKIQIQLINNNTAQTPAFGPSGPGENWIFIDELKMVDIVDTTGLGESNWSISDGAISLVPNTDTQFIAEGSTSMQLFYEMGQNGKPDYATIEKNITSIQGKKLHFKVYNRNGAGVGIFKIKATAFDESGVAHDLGSYPDDGNLGWSWPINWFTYEKPLPAGVVINKIQIQLINNNTAQVPTLGPGNAGENWIFIDELKMVDVVDTIGIGENNWSISDGAISLVPNNDAQFIAEGTTSMQMFYEMGQNGKPDYATIEKSIPNIQDRNLHFKVYNRNGAGVGVFKLKATVYDTTGVAYDLGLYPDSGNLGWSWPTNWFTYEKALPAGLVINKIKIQLINNNTAQTPAYGPSGPGENWIFIDELKFVDSVDILSVVNIDNMEDTNDWINISDAIGLQASSEFAFNGTDSGKMTYEFMQNGHGNTASIQKNLNSSEFIEGRALVFRVFNRNGAGTNNFKLNASIQDEDGVWYQLADWNDGNKLGWSGDGPASGNGWFTYCEMIPSNANKMKSIRINLVNDGTNAFGPGGPGENWIFVDDVSLVETGNTLIDDMNDVSKWTRNANSPALETSSAVAVSGINSAKMFYSFTPNETATITKTLSNNLDASSKYIKFSIFNRNGAGAGAFSLKATVTDINGTSIDLLPWYNGFNNNGNLLGWSGAEDAFNDGWYTYRAMVPAGTKPIKSISISLKNESTTTYTASGPGESWMYIDKLELLQDNYPFLSGESGTYNENMNKMWQIYGSTSDGNLTVNKYAGEPQYAEFVMNKLEWSDESSYIRNMKNIIRDYPITSDGWLWSTSSQENWPTDASKHFDGNANFILAVNKIVSWEGTSYLYEVDSNSAGGSDVSQGKTVIAKLRLAMNYMLNTLVGSSGVLTINNGRNTGLSNADLSNYWDNVRFGYKDAYTNSFFYPSLNAMSQIEKVVGNTSWASYYASLMPIVKNSYENTFWNNTTQRYAGWVDTSSTMHDYGFSYVNLQALTYGLGDQTKANSIFDWLDGNRVVQGDNSTGADIYHYNFAPRSNTKAISSGDWFDLGGIMPVTTTGSFGQHQANGGAILYTSYYDILSRIQYKGADNALSRLNGILGEFSIDQLKRDPENSYGTPHLLGITGEFPESGLVPLTHLRGFMGIDANSDSLAISPNIPTSMKYAGVVDLKYKGKTYNIIEKNDNILIQALDGSATSANFKISNMTPNYAFLLTNLDLTTGITTTTNYTSNGSGEILLNNINVSGTKRIQLAKVIIPFAIDYNVSSEKVITGLTQNTTKASFTGKIYIAGGATYKLFGKNNGPELLSGAIVGTGVRVEVVNGQVTDNYTVLIKGDIDGSGDIAVNDLVDVKKHLLKINLLRDIYKSAADITSDNTISINDFLSIKKQILNISTIVQVPVTGVTLDKSTMSIGIGETGNLTATINPSNAENKSVIWSSSNGNATVNNGVVTGVSSGTLIITASTAEGGFIAICEVTVLQLVSNLTLNDATMVIGKNATKLLSANTTPIGAINGMITWTSNNTDVATVDNNGLVTGIAIGMAIIMAKTSDGSKVATCAVTVTLFDSINYYKILNEQVKTVAMDVTNTGSNGVVKNVTYTGVNSQLWQVVDLGTGYYKIINKDTGLALCVTGSSNSTNASIIQSTYNSTNNAMQWSIVEISTGVYKFVSKLGNNTYIKGGSSSGTTLITASSGSLPTQQWTITVVS